MRRTVGLVIMLALASASVSVPITVHAQQTDEGIDLDLFVLSDEALPVAQKIQCPICEGQSIVASNATIAKQMRVVVQEQVDAGWSEAQILDYFEEAYGSLVLREPPLRGVAAGVWLAPPFIALIGIFLVAIVLRRWRRAAGPVLPSLVNVTDEALVEQHLANLGSEPRTSR